MNKTIVPICFLLLFGTGCPEPPMVSRTVSLGFPVPTNQTKVNLSVSDAKIQEAFKLIDTSLTSKGFVRDKNPANSTVQGFLASYSRVADGGLRRRDEMPDVYFRGNRLEVTFLGGRNPSGHLSPSTQELVDSLRTELISRYGTERVKTEK